MIYCSGNTCMPFLCCGLPCASSNCMHEQTTTCILGKCGSSLYFARAHDLPSCFKSTWIGNKQHSTVAFVELKYQKVSFDTMATFTFLAKWKCMASFTPFVWVSNCSATNIKTFSGTKLRPLTLWWQYDFAVGKVCFQCFQWGLATKRQHEIGQCSLQSALKSFI